jgi:Flp pilus assembly protein TadD
MKRLMTVAGFCAALLLTPAAFAQTGSVRGKVVDEKGQPVTAAKITWDFQGGVTRKGEISTNKKGEFVQVGLSPGNYRFIVNAEGFQPSTLDTRVGLGEPTILPEFKMTAARAAGGGGVDPGLAALKASVDEAITLASGGKVDEALAVYTDLAAKNPTIHQIPYNMAGLYSSRKDWANAEAAYKKALDVKPDYADAMVGLSSVYLNTGRGAEATDLIAKGIEANPSDTKLLVQQGALLFNTGKQAEAAEAFKKVVAADPTNAEPYYYLGTIALGQNKTAECIASLEKYLSLSPTNATNVATAKGLLAALKK